MGTQVNIGRTIARERRRAGVTQEALADHLGVSKAAVSKWELGQSLPDVSLLPRIAAYFSLLLDELFDWRDELGQEESAALYAEVCALGEKDPAAALERLRALAAEHYSDANLLLMLASLLTVWAGGRRAPMAPGAGEGAASGGVPGSPDDGPRADAPADDALADDALADEALALLDRVLEVAVDPSTLFLARQQKATTLFQAGRTEEAAAILEPLVRRQDASAPAMLLASAYRRLGREEDALELLQSERLRAAGLVLSSLLQEMGMRDDAPFARTAGAAAEAVLAALDMGEVNPLLSATTSLEAAEALRRAGERDGAVAALGRAVLAASPDAAPRDPAAPDAASPDAAASPLWDRLRERLDPSRAGVAWAEHKARQAGEGAALMRRALAERAASPEWRELAGDDPRFLEVVEAAARL